MGNLISIKQKMDSPRPISSQVALQPNVQPPETEKRFEPLNRCHYLLATIVNIINVVKHTFLTLLSILGAVVCLGLNKKMNAHVINNGIEIGFSFLAVGMSCFGTLCPTAVNKTLGRGVPQRVVEQPA